MKTLAIILSASLLSVSFSSNAQKSPEQVRSNQSVTSAPLKGYYSIGNNAAKLQSATGGQVTSGLRANKVKTKPTVQKGYYATGNNNTKLAEQVSFEEVAPSGQTKYRAKPVKGYYSIGRNANKLK
jgi:hypothetical protein